MRGSGQPLNRCIRGFAGGAGNDGNRGLSSGTQKTKVPGYAQSAPPWRRRVDSGNVHLPAGWHTVAPVLVKRSVGPACPAEPPAPARHLPGEVLFVPELLPRNARAYHSGLRRASAVSGDGLPHWSRIPTDDQDASAWVAARYPGWLHHTPVTGTWYVWNGQCHKPDDSALVSRMGRSLADDAMRWVNAWLEREEAAEARAKAHLDAAARYWKAVRRSSGHNGMLSMLAGQVGISADAMAEQHPEWLNVADGTLDLASLELRPHDPGDLITYCVDTPWRPEARAPMFWSLLSRMCGNDPEVADFCLRALGYGLLGHNLDRRIFFISGPTSSGKSQVLYIVRSVLGAIAHESQAELITYVRHGRNARSENSIRGKRLLSVTETSERMHIDEGQVKRLTGEPVISVDQHYAKTELKTPVTFTIYVVTNAMPAVTHFEDALRERIIVIPGGPTIPEAQRDRYLAEKILEREREGVLALLVKGCREFFLRGMDVPGAVAAETLKYQREQNTVAAFIEDVMVRDQSMTLSVPMTEAWSAYQSWARGSVALGRNQFYEAMAAEPGILRVDDHSRNRVFRGICLNGWAGR